MIDGSIVVDAWNEVPLLKQGCFDTWVEDDFRHMSEFLINRRVDQIEWARIGYAEVSFVHELNPNDHLFALGVLLSKLVSDQERSSIRERVECCAAVLLGDEEVLARMSTTMKAVAIKVVEQEARLRSISPFSDVAYFRERLMG